MTGQLTLQQIADLKASIAKKYVVLDYDFRDGNTPAWMVAFAESWIPINNNDHDDQLDAEAEMEAIIQDEVKAAMEEME